MKDISITTTVYTVRAAMIDGSIVDLLLFFRQQDAADHAAYVREHGRLLGYAELTVVSRKIIGTPLRTR